MNETDFAVRDEYNISESSFQFEEERLAKAFFSLPLHRQQILTMLFVEEKKPEEIARILRCSTDYVRLQKYRAIQKLRKLLSEEDHNEDFK